jgi:Na+/H+ antiporter NhaC
MKINQNSFWKTISRIEWSIVLLRTLVFYICVIFALGGLAIIEAIARGTNHLYVAVGEHWWSLSLIAIFFYFLMSLRRNYVKTKNL